MQVTDVQWILLIHQVPPEPGYLRVKVRRRLRRVGAVALKSTVYVVPAGDPGREDFEWLAREIRADGGEAILCEARFVGGLLDEDVRDLFRKEREAEYAEILRSVHDIADAGFDDAQATRLARIRRKFVEVTKLDAFDAPGRAAAEQAIADAEARLAGTAAESVSTPAHTRESLQGRTWVTRRCVHVDRMASTWLIRRFIDPNARFLFVDPEIYQPGPDEVRYDMFEAEFTHQGDRCTFEVLSALVTPEDSAIRAVAEIVHDIDLRDGKFGRAETAGIERLITGIQTAYPNDSDRIARANDVFEGLYQGFGRAG